MKMCQQVEISRNKTNFCTERQTMARDRLPELQKASSSKYSSSHSLPSSVNEQNIAMEAILTPYTDIRTHLAQISSNLEAMRRLMHITSIRDKNEEEMDKLRNQNIRIGNILMTQFQSFKANLPDESYSLEARIKRTLFYGLHQNYVIIWKKHEEFLVLYEQNLRKNLRLHSKLINQNATEEELETLIENKTTNLFVQNILEETEKERRTLRDLIDRLSELRRLEKSIEEVHALFIRIQNLVMEQNEIIQRVEFNVHQATQFSDKGANELKVAEKHKKNALKKKIIIYITILTLLVLLLLIGIFL